MNVIDGALFDQLEQHLDDKIEYVSEVMLGSAFTSPGADLQAIGGMYHHLAGQLNALRSVKGMVEDIRKGALSEDDE